MNTRNLARFLSGLILTALLAAAAPPVLADDFATISVYARGATLGQRVEVQWGDAIGGWHRVDGWSSSLDHLTPQGVPFQRFTVFSDNFGQGPFRWVIYNTDGVTVWAIGPKFTLPTQPGSDVAQPLDQQGPVSPLSTPAGVPTPTVPTTPVAPSAGEPLLRAHGFTYGVNSGTDSKISALIGGLPNTIWITVQWLDGFGHWQQVTGWQGLPFSFDSNGVLFQQWSVPSSLFGAGPFRWALYTYQGGPLIGVSPSFYMPTKPRLNFFMSMAPA